jgi:hypothetical protein
MWLRGSAQRHPGLRAVPRHPTLKGVAQTWPSENGFLQAVSHHRGTPLEFEDWKCTRFSQGATQSVADPGLLDVTPLAYQLRENDEFLVKLGTTEIIFNSGNSENYSDGGATRFRLRSRNGFRDSYSLSRSFMAAFSFSPAKRIAS